MTEPTITDPERVETDASLSAERDKADRLLAERAASMQRAAAAVVDLARHEADVLIETAREQTDAALEIAHEPADLIEEVVAARETEDELIEARRAAADAQLIAEQRAHQRAIKNLLAIEREETNQRLQNERERADHRVASRDDFLAMVSHDVRSLLGGLSMSADSLRRGTNHTPDRLGREADRIQRFTARMNRLVGDLLDLVGMEAGRLKVEMVTQDVRDLLTETLESFQAVAASRSIHLAAALPETPLITVFDHERMLQVLANLVGNAMKFTDPGGHITLAVARVEEAIEITVADDGCGIAPDLHETIFDRFSQTARHDQRGLGLGLYIARGLVESHGGRLWVTSAPGAGSTFHVLLPAG